MNKTQDIHNYQQRLDRTTERLSEEEFSTHNSKIALGFKNELLAQNISVSKTSHYLQDVIWLNRQFKGKNFDDVKREDVKELLANMNQSELAESTKKGLKIMLRKFYRFIRGVDEKGKYPHEVDFFTLTISKANSLLPEELLTEEDMRNIIRATKNDRDRALIALLCESGCRVGEIGALKIKHITFEEYGARIVVKGKTGMRKIIVLKVIQLPAYSPELNPIEQTWKKIKKWLAISIWATKEEFEMKIAESLNNLDLRVKMY